MKHSLKFLALLFFLLLNCFLLQAQKHFIYIQSENQQPFAVVLNGKVYSSSDYGYVILPKLEDGKYDFTISFPMNKFPDQTFSCSVNKKDEGYTLKNSTDGWALENLLTQKTLANTTSETEKKNAFGNMLSDVVNDSMLTKKTLPPVDTVASNSVVTNPASSNNVATDSVLQPQKISETKLDTGTNMLFVDKTQNGADTVNVFIPTETVANNPVTTTDKPVSIDTAAINNSSNQSVDSSNVNQPIDSNLTHVAENNNANQSSITANTETTATTDTSRHDVSNPFYKPDGNVTTENINTDSVSQATLLNTNNAVKQDCESTISDDELNKLKRKMFTHSSDNDMIQYAVKYLNKKCITTDQVKEIGRLFSSDDGRYSLYDAMYLHTYDYGNYASLANQIIDPYYKKRFAALLR